MTPAQLKFLNAACACLIACGLLIDSARGQDPEVEVAVLEGEVQVEAREVTDDVVVEDRMLFQNFQDANSLEAILLRYANRESGFVRRACELTPEQSEQLKQIDAGWIKGQLAEKKQDNDEGGNAVLRGIGRFLGGGNAVVIGGGDDETASKFKKVRTKIDAEINSVLNDEQREVLAEEKRSRDEFRREASAAVLVSSIDRQVYLSPPQRSELIEAVEGWIGKKQLYWMFYLSNNAYLPDLPRSVLSKCLDDEQIKGMDGMQRYNYEMDEFYIESNGMVQTVRFEDK